MFYVVNLDVKQSRQANDGVNIVKLAKERFRNSESLRKRSRRPNVTIIESLKAQTNFFSLPKTERRVFIQEASKRLRWKELRAVARIENRLLSQFNAH